jgi:hypothetical protein
MTAAAPLPLLHPVRTGKIDKSMSDIPASLMEKMTANVRDFAWYRAQSDIPLDIHMRAVRRSAGERAMSRRRIYLDQKYWIYCRDAASGKPQKPEHTEIWTQLVRLAGAGAIVCPVFYSVYAETMKLEHRSRFEVARVVDALSAGVSIRQPAESRVAEVSHFVWQRLFGCKSLEPLGYYGFVPHCHILGEMVPSDTGLPKDDEVAVQKACYDLQSGATWQELMGLHADRGPTRHDDSDFQHQQTEQAAAHRHEFKTYDQAFSIELDGVADLLEQDLQAFAQDLFRQRKLISIDEPPCSPRDLTRNVAAIIVSGLKMKRISTELPTTHIPASIHAAVRFKNKKYRKNDSHDFKHATAALGYCNAFFTEKALARLLTTPPLSFDQLYRCQVLHKEEDVIAYLQTL